jgi:polar amino acid transport system substrate-binding protein
MKKGIIIGLVLMFLFALVGCGNKTSSENKNTEGNKETAQEKAELSKIEQIKEAGKLVLGTSADYPPYEFHKIDGDKDEIVGFDIEIAKEIAADLGVELEIKDMNFKGLLPALQTGKIDIVIAGMNPTPAREKEVDFSKIYYKAVHSVLIRTEDKEKYKNLEDLKGIKVGAQKTSIQEQIAMNNIEDSKVTSLGKVTDLIVSLKSKKVDSIVVEGPVAKAYADKNEDIMVADIAVGDPEAGSAIAVKKGSNDFVEQINKTIDRLVQADKINELVAEANELVEE